MQFSHVLVRAFRLLREKPRLFYPRIGMTLVWSVFWVYLAQLVVPLLQSPVDYMLSQQVSPVQLLFVSVFILVMTPAELWMYNAYFFMVQQRHTSDEIDMWAAFHSGLLRLPQSIALFCLVGIIAGIYGVPGGVIYAYGLLHGHSLIQAAGVIISIAAVISVMLTLYFTPVSVVLGERSFLKNIKEGLIVSHDERHGVYLITLFSFAVLLLASLAHGSLQQIGIVGFLLSRLLTAIESVYLLIVNPELYLQVEDTAHLTEKAADSEPTDSDSEQDSTERKKEEKEP